MPVLVFSLVAHEYAHGYAALKQGDDTALMQGRLTLNPIPHIDLWLTIILPALLYFGSKGAFTFGGAKPVEVRPDKYRNYRRGDIIVSSAGVVTNLVIAVLFTVLFILLGLVAREFPSTAGGLAAAQRLLSWGVFLNLMLAFFNLLPIPPLDGSHILYHFLPRAIRDRYRAMQRFGFLPLLALMLFFPEWLRVLLKPAYVGMGLFFKVAHPFAAGAEWNIFQS
ncbi:MAG: site-2 protease family protein [Gemmatimonadales bacterium]|nr:site-2 protease family protein [Gemmatimonadales bacterium]